MSRTPGARSEGATGPAVLLVGHGSHLSADSSRPVHELARRLRETGAHPEVRVAFWKEEPFLPHALDLVESDEVVVVPIFTSVGYFTDRVVPRELEAHRPAHPSPAPRVRTCAPIGTHPGMARVVLERAREGAPLPPDREGKAVVVLIGHGTELHPESADTTRTVTARVAETGPYEAVVPAFLDQAPHVLDVLQGIDARDVILVPFFVSEGWHTRSTIPRQLGLEGPATTRDGVTLWYTEAVGTHPAMAEVVRDLVRDELRRDASGGRGAASTAPGAGTPPAPAEDRGIHRARRAFLERLSSGREGVPLRVVQAAVFPAGSGRFEVRHQDDEGASPDRLRSLGGLEDLVPLAGVSGNGDHRPLRTAPDLQRGWRLTGLSAGEAWEALGHLYPAVLLHRHLASEGTLSLTGYAEFASRQTGMYAGVERLPPPLVSSVVLACCGEDRCLRTPLWVDPPGQGGGGVGAEVAPCPAPCPILLSAARDALREHDCGPAGECGG